MVIALFIFQWQHSNSIRNYLALFSNYQLEGLIRTGDLAAIKNLLDNVTDQKTISEIAAQVTSIYLTLELLVYTSLKV